MCVGKKPNVPFAGWLSFTMRHNGRVLPFVADLENKMFNLKQKINMCTTTQIKHRTRNDGNNVLCGVCSFNKRPAVKMNGVNVCHDCLKFVNYRSKLEDNTPFIQLDIDTRYVASNAT